MRKLIYVPILHSSTDLGSVAAEAEKKGIERVGEEGWKKHKETISKFWDSVSDYLNFLDVEGFKIYQDALVSSGEAAVQMIETVAERGSRNYELISKLIKKGAILVKTEDRSLVQEEVKKIKNMAQKPSKLGKFAAALKYKLSKKRLLEERDAFIAKQIAETLGDGETGVLFIGTFHNILSKLENDIEVREIKEIEKVRRYQKIFSLKGKKSEAEKLSAYLASPIR